MNQLRDQTVALAGMFQAAVLIEDMATTGGCEADAFDGSFSSLFTFDAATSTEVYGQTNCLRRGFKALVDYLGGRSAESSRNVAYYVLSMLKLAKIVRSSPVLSTQLLAGLQGIQRRSDEFELSRSSQVGKIDALYQDTISQLTPRIMVRGEQSHLLTEETAARIRTLLLAGIRSAVLWQQLGGGKWTLFLKRKRYVTEASSLLDESQIS